MFAFGIHISDSYAARLTHGFILGLADGLISFNGLAAMFGDRPNHETWIVVGELFPNLALRLRHQIARREFQGVFSLRRVFRHQLVRVVSL